jgi:CO/xanthine dehydrogenase FAD-binding subunit
MRPFVYERATDPNQAVNTANQSAGTRSGVQFLAGGTTLLDLLFAWLMLRSIVSYASSIR